MNLPDSSRFPGPDELWLPGVTRKAQTTHEFMDWVNSAAMEPVFDRLATEALRMNEDLGSDQLMGKRGLWLLLVVEAICRQQGSVGLGENNDAEMAEGVGIISEMILGAAGAAYMIQEPLRSQQFWKDFILALSMAWGGPAIILGLNPHRLYAVQIRRLRDSQSR